MLSKDLQLAQKRDLSDDVLAQMEIRVDEKLAGILKGSVQDAFRAAFEAFSIQVGSKIQNLDDRLNEVALRDKSEKT